MEWWDGDGRSSPWLDLHETKEDSSSTPNHNHHHHHHHNNKAENEAAAGLHDLAYLAALPSEDTGPALPPRKRKPFVEYLSDSSDRKLAAKSSKQRSPQKKKQRGLNHNAGFSHPPIESVARKQWNYVIVEQSKAQKELLDAHTEHEKSQLSLDSAKMRSEQAQQTVQKTCKDLYLTLIQEDASWCESYQLLKVYKKGYGTTAVPRAPKKELTDRDPTLSKLSKWVGMNRRDYRKGILEDYKIYALNEIEFDWNPCQTNWSTKYQLLAKFQQQHGHARVKYSSTKEEDGGLGMWVKRQQYQYKLFQEGNPSELTHERIQLLNDIGMVWKRRSESWMNRFRELQKFKMTYGHIQVTATVDASLLEWVRDQRTQWKKYQMDPAQSSLTDKQVALLEMIGFEVDVRDSKWQTKFQELLNFHKTHGHTCIPTKYPFNQSLSNWWGTQRRQYALYVQGQKSQLTKERVQQLLDAGLDVDGSDAKKTKPKMQKTWDEVYAELRHYQNREQSLIPPANSAVGKWCEQQRDALKAIPCGLTGEQVEKLNRLDFDWGSTMASILLPKAVSTSRSWEERLGELLAYRLQSKSYQLPPDRQDLRDWVEQQRADFQNYQDDKPCNLTRARIEQLQAVDFPFQSSHQATSISLKKSWAELYLELLQYRLRNGNFAISRNNIDDSKELYEWCQDQRAAYQELQNEEGGTSSVPTLTEQRLNKLKGIHFPWEEEQEEDDSDNTEEDEDDVSAVVEPSPLHGSAVPASEKPYPLLTATLEESTSPMEDSNLPLPYYGPNLLQYGPFFPLDLSQITAPTDIAWSSSQPSPRLLLRAAQDAILRLSHDDVEEESTSALEGKPLL
jgi:hypothetical protein